MNKAHTPPAPVVPSSRHARPIRIAGTATCLPPKVRTAADLDALTGAPEGWTARKTGVLTRHVADGQTASQLAAQAVFDALEAADCTVDDLDAVIVTSATPEQPIPHTASLVLEAMGVERGITAFDVNATCLSFVVGLDMLAWPLAAGRFDRIAVVASEITSVGLNPDHRESAALFGDGAAAAILERTPDDGTASLLLAHQEMYSEGAHLCEIPGGGTGRHPNSEGRVPTDFMFQMHGPALYMMAADLIPDFLDRFFADLPFGIDDVDLVIAHQGSIPAMKLMCRKMRIAEERFHVIADTVGNTVAASIPMGLDRAIRTGRLQRGQLVLLVGTSAGFGLGAALLRY